MNWLEKLKEKLVGTSDPVSAVDERQRRPGTGTALRSSADSAAAAKASPPVLSGEADLSEPGWKVGEVILGLYEVERVHEGGGMGLVYRVRHRGWNTDLAIKSPRREYFATDTDRENFTRECETWISLGLHPHIVSCHYIRAIDGVPRVFAEYVNGGSLHEWIESRRLYEGGQEEALKRILDVAIQMAWGLQHAHEQGLIHQDVKPANVLMTPDGTAKITDFGLAKARPAARSVETQTGRTVLVSSGGMTPAYCSPEQARFDSLSRKTDIWSWAVSVLEMFVGEVCWESGVVAPEVLQQLNDFRVKGIWLSEMPAEVMDLLRHCFELKSENRPKNMLEITERLRAMYRSLIRNDYPRLLPESIEWRADSLNNRAISFLDLGRAAESEDLLLNALAIDPTHAEANFNYQLLLWRSGRVTDASAISSLTNLLQIHSDTALER